MNSNRFIDNVYIEAYVSDFRDSQRMCWHTHCRASQVAQWQKICLPMQETQVQYLGWEDPLEKEMATHSSSLSWEIPWTETGSLPSMGGKRVGQD